MAKQKRRNFHATHPIMRKGGVHEKSNGAKRKAAKLATKKLAGESRCRALFGMLKKYRHSYGKPIGSRGGGSHPQAGCLC